MEIDITLDQCILPTQVRDEQSAAYAEPKLRELGESMRVRQISAVETFPLPPNPSASLECLLGRLHRIHDQLVIRGFSDAVASRAVDEVLDVGQKALSSGKAGRMNGEERAAWLWMVAVNAARRAASREIVFVSLNHDLPDLRACAAAVESDELRMALSDEIDRLPGRQKQAIILHGLQGASLRMAAREMGVRPSTVGRQYHAGIGNLASALHALAEQAHGEKPCEESGARALMVGESLLLQTEVTTSDNKASQVSSITP